MVKIGTRKYYRRRLLEAIGNQSPEELGKLAIELMENTEKVYEEAAITDRVEEDTFDYERSNDEDNYKEMYDNLKSEYEARFGGSLSEEPLKQPLADDITLQMNPNTGTEQKVEGNGGNDPDEKYDDDIFDYEEE